MFINFGTFGLNQPDFTQQRQQNNQNRQNNMGGFFNQLGNFLNQQFMNPFNNFMNNNNHNHNHNQQQQQEQQPTYRRNYGKKQQEQKKGSQKKQQKHKINYPQNTGMYWKQKGNQQFIKGKNQIALQYYNKAIQLNNTQSIFYSNRAQCLKKMGKYQLAYKDALQSIQLDTSNMKGFYYCGLTLAEIGKHQKNINKIANAIKKLTKALTLCENQKKGEQIKNNISIHIYRGKKLLWYLQFEQIKQKRMKAINEYKNYLLNDIKLNQQTRQSKLRQFAYAINQHNFIFQIPDYLQCKITHEIIEDPAVTNSGQVYQRQMIQKHIDNHGRIDPITRKPIDGTIYPCFGMKKAVQDFLQKNPWAYEYNEKQNYMDIQF